MAFPFIGEIRAVGFDFAPIGWLACEGQLLDIATYDTLFQLIGTTYGGDGQFTFGLPDLRGRIPISQGLTHLMGNMEGEESHYLTPNEMPSHSHTIAASNLAATSSNPQTGSFAAILQGTKSDRAYSNVAPNSTMGNVVVAAGGNQSHNNMMPSQCFNFIIAYEGIFPTP